MLFTSVHSHLFLRSLDNTGPRCLKGKAILLSVYAVWRHRPDPPDELASSSINPPAGPPSHPRFRRTSQAVRLLAWIDVVGHGGRVLQVASPRSPLGPTSGRGRPPNLSTSPHGGWIRAPLPPSLGTPWEWGFPTLGECRTSNVDCTYLTIGNVMKFFPKIEDVCYNCHTRISVGCRDVCGTVEAGVMK